MSVRASLLFALVVAGGAGSGFSQDTGAQGFAPEIRAIEDYEHVWARSPFVVETKAIAESDGLAQKYSLAAMAKDPAGNPVLFLIERGTHQRIMIPSKSHPLEVVSVSMDREIRKSSAVIRQGGEQATITYDEMLLGQPVAAMAPQNLLPGQNRIRPQTPGVPSPPGGILSPAIPAPPKRAIQTAPGVPVTPDQDDAAAEAPKSKSIIRRPTINTHNP